MLSPAQISEFKTILDQRYQELREEIRKVLLESDKEQFQKLAGEVHDREELSVADLLVDINYAEIDHLLKELHETEDALRRIREGRYGICVDTGESIDLERLKAYPAAKRTLRAQTIYEKTHAGETHASL